MGMRTVALIAGICCIPFFATADVSAGFPAQSIWFSNTAPSYGETVRVFTVLYNGTGTTIEGTVEFIADGTSHEMQPVTLKSGESRVLSSIWTAETGQHAFSARFKAGTITQSSVSVTISVAAPPKPSPVEEAMQKAGSITDTIASSSAPIVKQAAQAVFEKTETLRNAAIAYVEPYADLDVQKRAGDVRGASTTAAVSGFAAPASSTSKISSLAHSARQMAAAGALFTLRSMWLFYPLTVFLIVIFLRRIYRWATGPRF